MKKGCLIKLLVVSTIIFAAVFYIFTNKLDTWIVKPIKSFVYDSAFGEVKENIELLKPSTEKDSLVNVLKGIMTDFENKKNININVKHLNSIADSLLSFTSDSVITPEELNRFIKLVKDEKYYEK